MANQKTRSRFIKVMFGCIIDLQRPIVLPRECQYESEIGIDVLPSRIGLGISRRLFKHSDRFIG
ncbi:hypothetical protein AQZ49_16710 [Novosphingobium sp. FSW06-99]|nr:hypothetical protein AQZ49_16710 [Novosphingobium sp. FSW06-99]